jgi:hypothetical protein
MMYLILSFLTATVFGLVSFGIYGHEGMLQNPWVDYVFWWLIGTGIGLALFDNTIRCPLCQRVPSLPALCQDAPCA